jgi:hypothetical protein
MRTLAAKHWAFVVAAFGLLAACVPATRAADDVTGKWNLGVIQITDTDLMVLDLKEDGGKLSAEVLDSRFGARKPEINSVAMEDGKLVLKMLLGANEAVFTQGTAKGDSIYGTFAINGQNIPARLTRTESAKLPPQDPNAQEKLRPLITAMNSRDPKDRTEKLQAIIKENADPVKNYPLYGLLFASAEEGGLSEKAVRGYYKEWLDAAKQFGQPLAEATQINAIKSLTGKTSFAGLTLELAQEAEQALPETASIQTRADLTQAVALSAKTVGKADLAAAAEEKLAKLDAELDAEYHKKVPPFKPEASVAREKKDATRVVLFELFTGAQCPPCVAADVAFDALNTSYTPKEVILLQYHLHIPGPDPLTNADTEARSKYYGDDLRGTPTTFFNGKSLAGGGGGMANSEGKYTEYRELIDPMLEADKKADIDLKAALDGEVVTINATAKAGDAAKDAKALKLRFALIEESVRYVGGNGLRFHHHVVRALPGGPDGLELKDGEGKADLTVKLADLRQGLETYLSDFEKNRPFPNPLPSIKLENLSVVAFVQDDDDHSVLHAVLVPLGAGHEEKKDAK